MSSDSNFGQRPFITSVLISPDAHTKKGVRAQCGNETCGPNTDADASGLERIPPGVVHCRS